MGTYKIDWHWFTGGGFGNDYTTIDVNIPPAWIGAQVSLHGGGAPSYVGIKHYRRRLSSGADEDHDFGEWKSWPPVIFDFISSITFAVGAGPDQQAWVVARMDYWD
jgi:hypothetical protein